MILVQLIHLLFQSQLVLQSTLSRSTNSQWKSTSNCRYGGESELVKTPYQWLCRWPDLNNYMQCLQVSVDCRHLRKRWNGNDIVAAAAERWMLCERSNFRGVIPASFTFGALSMRHTNPDFVRSLNETLTRIWYLTDELFIFHRWKHLHLCIIVIQIGEGTGLIKVILAI